MKLSTRLTLAMVALVLLTATAIGLLSYRNMVELTLPRALDRIDIQARVAAGVLETTIGSARADAASFRSTAAVDGYVRAKLTGGVHPLDGSTETQWRDRVSSRFMAELAAKPSYAQFRLIGIADGGRELVRVDRRGPDGAIRVAPDSELQRTGDEDYFKETIRLSPGEAYISPIDLNKEHGAIAIPYVPTVRAAAPVFASDDTLFGIVIINVDLRSTFANIRSFERGAGEVYLVSERGDYLLHPDPARTFGFEFGRPVRVQDDFPETARLLAMADTAPRIVHDRSGERFALGWELASPAGGPRVTVVETMPYSQVIAAASAVRDASLVGGLAAVLGAIVLAVVLARSLTRPLVQMTGAVKSFTRDGAITVPMGASGEIGVLADTFIRMTAEMRENEQRLKEQGERFETALNSMRQGLLMFDSESRLILYNRRYLDMYGLSSETVKPGCTLRDLLQLRKAAGSFKGDPDQYIAKFVDHGKVETKAVTLPDGRTISVTNAPAPGGGWVSTHDDISERRRAEEERDRTRAFLDTVVEKVPATLVVKDARDGRYVLVNRHGEDFFGMPRAEMIGKTAYDFFPREEADIIAVRDKEALESGQELLVENNPVRLPHKGMRLVTTKRVAIRDGGGEPQYLLAFIDDVTERKRAEEALRDSEQMARRIIDTALDAFVQMDEAGNIIEWNPQAEAIFGWSREDVIGKELATIIVPEDHRARHKAGLEQFLHTGEGTILGKRMELDANRRDGSQIKLELTVTALQRRSGYVFNGFMRDITEKLATEEKFRQAQKMDAVGQLTGGIAHDFNNMLTVIIGTVEILADAVADRPELAATAKMIDEAAQRGAELTERLLAFARKQPLQPRETDINTLMTESAELLRRTLGENVEIETKLADDTWPALVDPGQLSSALVNLALNARDAMPNGGKLTLETSNIVLHDDDQPPHKELQPGSYVIVAVSDTGIGIPAAIRDRVFEPFFTTKDVGKGTGLGLSMVYGFTKQSGGHIKIYSEEDNGTTIRLYLPRAGADANAAADAPRSAALQRGSETILLVEDDELVRQQVKAQLESLGYTMVTAPNAVEALALLDRGARADLLFTDIIMPGGMNGRQLADEVIKRRPSIKVLYTSGYSENAMIHQGRLEAGVSLLQKPYRKADLARLVRRALGDASVDEPAQARVSRPRKPVKRAG